jgi:hypothetical protein
MKGNHRISVLNMPWYVNEKPTQTEMNT